ncbi:MAG: hypothetical protein NZ481_09160 [Candidatus Kapabacteria bacterium]|nr:hypothetical protein [Candidatus Kapabacteria bacterium]
MNPLLLVLLTVVIVKFGGCVSVPAESERQTGYQSKQTQQGDTQTQQGDELQMPFGRLTKKQAIERYFTGRPLDFVEGIWVSDDASYEVAIIKNVSDDFPYDYVGVVTYTARNNWQVGEIKMLLKKTTSDDTYPTIYFMGDKSGYGTTLTISKDGDRMMGDIWLRGYIVPTKIHFMRTYPKR